MRSNVIIFISVLILLCVLISCSTQKRVATNLPDAIANDDPLVARGRIVFKLKCDKCHPDGQGGLGPPVIGTHLPGFLIRYRVRSKSFLLWMGRMPSFDKHEISKDDMKALLAFIRKYH
jgi:hypothetical protein